VHIETETGATMRVRGLGLLLILATLGVVGSVVYAGAADQNTGKVRIESKTIAVGVGVSWGEGVLEYRGKKYPFTLKGLNVADVGVSKVAAVGEVTNLKKVEDFAGTYVAGTAGAAVGGGAGASALQNEKEVRMTLTGTGQGVRFTAAGSGVEVALKKK
jgi:hypothetical protein